MTREEEIRKQAEKKALEPSRLMHPYAKQYKVMSAYEIGFIEGAVWADEHPHWISVEDELPPMHCHLHDLGESTYGRGEIFCDSEPVITHRVDGCIDMHCLMFNGEQNEFVWGGWNGSHSQPFDGSMITHWMPFPSVEHLRETTKMIKKGGKE